MFKRYDIKKENETKKRKQTYIWVYDKLFQFSGILVLSKYNFIR